MLTDAGINVPPTTATTSVVQEAKARPTQVIWDSQNPTQLTLMRTDAPAKPFGAELAKQLARLYPNISTRQDVLGGTPHLRGTRLSVASVVSAVCVHGSLDAALADYRNRYTREQFEDALRFVRDFLTESL
jgi:uncharacterized protein (DUF433 family)